jgi:hypothetical protein
MQVSRAQQTGTNQQQVWTRGSARYRGRRRTQEIALFYRTIW